MNSSDFAWCYQTLELPIDATEQEIKTAYRQLVRQYHPDLNRGDRQAEDRFKQIVLAYKTLIAALPQLPKSNRANTQKETATSTSTTTSSTSNKVRIYVKQPEPKATKPTNLSSEEKLHKLSNLNQIYHLLKHQKWQQAIEVAEKLVNCFPGDPDVCQWQALTYHRWGRKLIERQQYDRARLYLKKALQSDPHNQQLWLAIDRDYKEIERKLRL